MDYIQQMTMNWSENTRNAFAAANQLIPRHINQLNPVQINQNQNQFIAYQLHTQIIGRYEQRIHNYNATIYQLNTNTGRPSPQPKDITNVSEYIETILFGHNEYYYHYDDILDLCV